MAISDLMNSPGPSSWYDELWRATVEDNLNYLLSQNTVKPLYIEPIIHEHFKNNFYGFLREKVTEAEPRYWYTILRVNGMTSPHDFDDRFDFILMPQLSLVDELHELYISSLKS